MDVRTGDEKQKVMREKIGVTGRGAGTRGSKTGSGEAVGF